MYQKINQALEQSQNYIGVGKLLITQQIWPCVFPKVYLSFANYF
jgi:hypothetical protein